MNMFSDIGRESAAGWIKAEMTSLIDYRIDQHTGNKKVRAELRLLRLELEKICEEGSKA